MNHDHATAIMCDEEKLVLMADGTNERRRMLFRRIKNAVYIDVVIFIDDRTDSWKTFRLEPEQVEQIRAFLAEDMDTTAPNKTGVSKEPITRPASEPEWLAEALNSGEGVYRP